MMVPKFRVWDEIQHKMLQVDYIEFIDGKAYWVEASSADDNPQGGNDGPVGDNSQLKLEQSTGLKDVNGKEIYEGDVVQPVSFHINLKRGKPFEVKKGNYVYGKWIAKDISNKGFGVDGCYFDYEIQVVGNVHENPELLEAQHDTRTD